jgi:outer membrane lipoprotein LolB
MSRWIAPLWLALVLGGCATTAPVPSEPVGAQISTNWTLQGRIGIQTDEQSLSGSLRWQHREQSDELLLTSPLGQGVARIRVGAEGAVLDMPNQPARHAADVESLTREALGYSLPVAGLVWWVQAQPAPDRTFETRRDTAGRLAQLKQDGWVINYQYAADTSVRPRKLVVVRDGMEIRLIADSWSVE